MLKSVEIITASGNKCVLVRDELFYSYRSSPFQNVPLGSATIVGASFELKPSLECRETQIFYLERYAFLENGSEVNFFKFSWRSYA